MSSSSSSHQQQQPPSAAPSQPTRSVPPPRSTHASYHPGGYGVSEGLKRARRPFLVRNAVTGSAIMAFAVGVYWYSISKVKQDDFSDLADVTRANSSSAMARPDLVVPATQSGPETSAQDRTKRV